MKKLVFMVSALTLLAGCGATENSENLTDVTVILDYVANTNHTGMYVAIENGYYEELGLNVNIIEPVEGATATLIAMGKGDIGISYQEDVTVALTSVEPLPIKAIGTILQQNTSGFSTHTSKNITSVKDFEGKVYAGWGGAGETAVLEAVMKQNNADFSKLEMVFSDGSGMSSLENNVDILWTFEAWDNISAQMMGIDVNYMQLSDLDERLDYYTPVIITSEDKIENDPEMLSAFMQATEKGYIFASENPRESAEILSNYTDGYDIEFLTLSQEYLADKYLKNGKFGTMQDIVWDRYTEFLLEYNVIDTEISASDCYTNEFLLK